MEIAVTLRRSNGFYMHTQNEHVMPRLGLGIHEFGLARSTPSD
jgi:hypothetical protein